MIQIVPVGLLADLLHALFEPPLERGPLVAREIESPIGPKELEQGVELPLLLVVRGLPILQRHHPVRIRGPRPSILFRRRVALGRLPHLSLRGHRTGSLDTRDTSAPAISSSGRMRSTDPVWIAEPGIPENSELLMDCAMTVPPIRLTALTPVAPSRPVPERTTATARSLHTTATDSKRRSAEGRRKFTGSAPDSAMVPSS